MRDAARGLRRTPGTAAAIVILLSLGIGANATMFEIVDRLLLRPPDHVVDADRLRMVYSQRPTLSLPQFARNLTYSDVADIKSLPALAAGLLIGTALAAAAGRFVEGLLFNVRTSDPLVYGAVVIVLGAAGLAASLGPAWRATSVNPSSALQAE